MPTVRQLCATFGVSTSTLDIVLRELAARGAIVREHGRGIYVSPTIDQQTIGVVFGGDIFSPPFSPFWGLLLQAVRAQAGARGMRPLAYLDISQRHAGLGGHAQLMEDIAAQRLDGLLLLAPHFADNETGPWRATGIPRVIFGGKLPDWAVIFDHTRAVRLAAREVAARGNGRVACIGHAAHRALLEDALRAAGVAAAQVIDWSYETWAPRIPVAGSQENCAYLLTQRMIADGALPDSLVSMEDTSTRGAITALRQAGLQPGRDLPIATIVNKGSPILDPYADAVSCLVFDPAECVRAALDLLATLIDGGTPPRNPVMIAPTLVGNTANR